MERTTPKRDGTQPEALSITRLQRLHLLNTSLEVFVLTFFIRMSLLLTSPWHVQVLLTALFQWHEQTCTAVTVFKRNSVLLVLFVSKRLWE